MNPSPENDPNYGLDPLGWLPHLYDQTNLALCQGPYPTQNPFQELPGSNLDSKSLAPTWTRNTGQDHYTQSNWESELIHQYKPTLNPYDPLYFNTNLTEHPPLPLAFHNPPTNTSNTMSTNNYPHTIMPPPPTNPGDPEEDKIRMGIPSDQLAELENPNDPKETLSYWTNRGVKLTIGGNEWTHQNQLGLCVDTYQHESGQWALCPECQVLFRTSSIIRHLMTVHKNEHSVVKCRFNNDQKWRVCFAVLEPTTPQDEIFQCFKCSEDFLSPSSLLTHKLDHLPVEGMYSSPRLPCPMGGCTGTFTTPTALKRHFRRTHSRRLTFPCDVCGHAESDPTKAELHLLVSHPNEPPSYRFCRFGCEDIFPTAAARKSHEIIQHHPNRFCYTCQICGKSLESRLTREIHQATHHSAQLKKYLTCSLCGKTKRSIKDMSKCISTHISKGPKVCKYQPCLFRFFKNTEYSQHLNTMHGGGSERWTA